MQRRIQWALHERMVGETVDVLVDHTSRRREWELSGRTPGNTVVNFPGPPSLLGRTVAVTIRRAGPNSVWGETAGEASLLPSGGAVAAGPEAARGQGGVA
jgi:tRNA-2-methylthio-N6-dimethylallyladenosine synthase